MKLGNSLNWVRVLRSRFSLRSTGASKTFLFLIVLLLLASWWVAGPASAQPTNLLISSATVAGPDLTLRGSGGVAGDLYYLLMSSNAALSPKSLWTSISTNVFAADGHFTNTIALSCLFSETFLQVAQSLTPTGLVAAYSFDEGAGSIATDASGKGNAGTLADATWTSAGKYGRALLFNGTNALVTVPDSLSLHLTTGLTLEAWVNPATIGNAFEDLVYKGDDNYFLEASSTGNGAPVLGGTFSPDPLSGIAPLPVNTWTHLAATYDGATMRLYVNGLQVASQAQTGPVATSTDPLQLGGDSLYGQFFQGLLDEVRVYQVALTPAQIQADMIIPVGNVPTSPWNLAATPVSGTQISLSWTASTGNAGVTAYLVERQGPGSTNFVQIGTSTGTTYNDPGLTTNTLYTYRVRATNGAGDLSAYSNLAQAYTGLAISPRAVAVTLSRTQQFTINFRNLSIVWSVDGVLGGTVASGTITAAGLYSPPNSVGTHTVTAATSDQSQSVSAVVYVTGCPGAFTYHNDNLRSGQNLNETVLTPANVNSSSFGKLFSYTLDGLTFASPLYATNINIPGNGPRNVVYVATEHDSVYAFDADGLATVPLWQVSFINEGAGVTTVPAADTGETGDIPSEIGITSTPVIDPGSGTLYTVAKTKEVSGDTTTYVQRLHALDLATGAEKFGGPVVIQATVPGDGPGSQDGQVSFDPLLENQRTALLLANGLVYLGFASHGDNPPYYGWVLGYNAATLQQVMAFNSCPDAAKGGIWMNGDGPATDSTNLFFITGDGDFDADSGGADYGDCFVKINSAATVLDYFSPSVQTSLDADNLDLGSGGVLLLPDQPGPHPHEMISAGKNGTIYLVDRDNMGHYHSDSDQIVQALVDVFTKVTGEEGGNFSSPVYFNGYVYFSPVSDNIQAFQLSNGMLTAFPTSQTSDIYDFRGGTMAVSANAATNGILWSLQSNGTDVPGVLHAYDATNLGVELYNSGQAPVRDTLDAWWKFTVPVVANGKVFITSLSQLLP